MTETIKLNFNEAFESNRTAWVQWPEGAFDVHLKYLSVEASEKIFKESQVVKWDQKTHQKVESLSEEKFISKLADLIVDWKDVTPEKTKHLVPYKKGTQMDGVFPCDQAHKLNFLKRFKGFMAWVLDTTRELHRFEEEQEEVEIKN